MASENSNKKQNYKGSPPVICCQVCYDTGDVCKPDCCKSFGCATFFGCDGCFSAGKPGAPYKSCQTYTAVARSVVQLLIVVFGLLTIMEFGTMMDNSHFPGAGIKLDRYDEGNNTDLLWDSFKEGYFLEIVDQGFNNINASECSNFITQADLNVTSNGVLLCQGTTNQTQEWETGWVSAYTCDRSSKDLLGMDNSCLGWSGNVAMFGTLTFYMLLAYAMLFLLATWIEHNHGYSYIAEYSIADRLSCWKDKRRIGDETDTFYDKPVRGWCCRNTGERNVVWITLVWAAVGSLYAIMAAGSWASMCDKLDTGLGRKISVVNPENELVVIPNGHACATIGCEATFASSFMWYALTVVWMLLPQVFMFYFPALTPANTAILKTDVEEQQPEQQPLVGAGTADKADEQGPGYYRHYTGHLKM
tara:strand:+ start:1638 stop:2891 length:1254 start_codon:yes stop_codon:yes gene_type:complete